MRVKVNWDTDGRSVKELGLPEVVNMPTLNEESIADYLSDEYGYCVESFKIEDLDSGFWHGEYAWVLSEDGSEMSILVGSHTLEQAIEAKEAADNDWESEYDDYIVWTDSEEWLKQQEY
jgi:hypothetical protein